MNAADDAGPTRELSGLDWRKSKHSGGNGNCVEVAKMHTGHVAVRHSKTPEGPAIVYTPGEIKAFLAGVKDGEFDYLVA